MRESNLVESWGMAAMALIERISLCVCVCECVCKCVRVCAHGYECVNVVVAYRK